MTITPEVAAADLAVLRIYEESEYGVTPSPAPASDLLRYNSHSLAEVAGTQISPELRGDRQTNGMKRVSRAVQGGLECQISFESHDDLYCAAIGSDGFDTQPTANTGTYGLTASSGVIAGTGVATNVEVGDLVLLSGFTTAADRVYKVVARASADAMTLDPKPPADVASASGRTVRIFAQAVNGTTIRTFGIEEQHTDLSNAYLLFAGLLVDGMTVRAEDQQLPTVSFTFAGKKAVPASSTVVGSTTAANTNDIMGPVDEINAIVYGVRGSVEDFPVRRTEIQVNANGRPIRNLGNDGPSSMNFGRLEIIPTLEIYCRSLAQYTRFVNQTDNLSLLIVFRDVDGNYLAFDIMRCKVEDSPKPNPGENSDIIETVRLRSLLQQDEGRMFRIHKLSAS